MAKSAEGLSFREKLQQASSFGRQPWEWNGGFNQPLVGQSRQKGHLPGLDHYDGYDDQGGARENE